jgi:endonuclease/exonuclease/phosphatase family metal-dependent hydrolase
MLRVMTYNIRNGGVEDDLTNRIPLIHDVIREVSPDILAVQEANEFEARSFYRLFDFERATGLRGLLGLSSTGFHGAIFLRRDFQPLTLRVDSTSGNNAVLDLSLRTPNGFQLTVCSVHLDPVSADIRLAGAHHSTAAPPAIVMGDFNNCRADDPGAQEAFEQAAPRRKARAGTDRFDDRALLAVERSGYVDLFRHLHPGELGHTILPGGRIDYIFATVDLTACAQICEVVRTPLAERASDHFPIFADFDIDV